MEALILAAGFATRLYPLTENRAKSLLDVAGLPAVGHILRSLFPLAEVGLSRIVILSNDRYVDDFRRALPGPYPVPVVIENNGVKTEEGKKGAVGDMALGAGLMAPGVPFLCLAGDNLFDFDLLAAHRRFQQRRGSRPLVLLYRLESVAEASLYNNVTLDETGRLLSFEEKPANPTSPLFGTCIYLFPPDIAHDLAVYEKQGGDQDKAGYFIKWLAKRRHVYTLEMPGHWFDVGSVEVLAAANAHFRENA